MDVHKSSPEIQFQSLWSNASPSSCKNWSMIAFSSVKHLSFTMSCPSFHFWVVFGPRNAQCPTMTKKAKVLAANSWHRSASVLVESKCPPQPPLNLVHQNFCSSSSLLCPLSFFWAMSCTEYALQLLVQSALLERPASATVSYL